MRSDAIRLLKTLPHDCGYFDDRTAQNLVIDPLAHDQPRLFELALTRGFRRAGGHIYRPACGRCTACIAARIPVAEFTPDRSQRRTWQRNRDLSVHVAEARASDERFALYRRYLAARHRDGGMDDPAPEDFERFLTCGWSPTVFIELRLGTTLVAVAVTDTTRHGWSSVYTFYEPALAARGLGTQSILVQVEHARAAGVPHLYLGYWIAGHPKMDYKARFRPLELLRDGRWQRHAHA